MSKLKNKELIYFALAILIPMGIAFSWYWYQGFYPIGNRVFFTSDLSQQYRGFYMYFKYWLEGKESLQFSWHIFSGSNMIGVVPYYLGSVFNFVLIFFSESHLYAGIVTILLFKILATGETSYIYFRSILKKQPILALALSTCFTFSGMLVGYFFNIIWLDVFVYLPLVILGLKKLVEQRKINFLFIVSLTLLLISNFYMAYMVGLLTVCWLTFQIVDANYNWKQIRKVIYSYVISALSIIGLSSFLIIPTLIQLGTVEKHGFQIQSSWFYDAFKFLGKMFNGVYYPADYINVDKSGGVYPHIYSGLLVLVILIPFILNKSISIKKRIGLSSILGLLSVSLLWQPLGIIWHGFNEPTGFPFRFAFLFSFVILTMAAEHLNKMDVKNSPNIIYGAVIVSILWEFISFTNPSISLMKWWGNQLLIVIFTLLLWSQRKNNIWKKTTQVLILILCILDVGINASLVTDQMSVNDNFNNYYDENYYSADQDKNVVDSMKTIKKDSKENDNIVRTRLEYKDFQNSSFYYDYSSIKGFSSVLDKNYQNMMAAMGNHSSRVSVKDGGTVISSMLLNEQYIVSPTYRDTPADYPEVVKQDTHTIISKRNYSMPAGICVKNELNENFNTNPLAQIVALMGGKPNDILREMPTPTPEISGADLRGDTYVRTSQPAVLKYKIPKLKKNELLYFSINTSNSLKGIDLKNGNQHDNLQMGYTLINPKATDVELSWDEDQKVDDYSTSFTIVDCKKWENLVKTTSQKDSSFKMTSHDNSSFTGNIEYSGRFGKELILVPYNDGWNYKVNGRTVKTQRVLNDLTLVDVPKNKKNVKITAKFRSPGMQLGSCITGLTVLMMILYQIYRKKTNAKNNFK